MSTRQKLPGDDLKPLHRRYAVATAATVLHFRRATGNAARNFDGPSPEEIIVPDGRVRRFTPEWGRLVRLVLARADALRSLGAP